jgi:hypothetical protein
LEPLASKLELGELEVWGRSQTTFTRQGRYTAILYRASTGPVQGQNRDFPVKFSHTGKNLFSLQGILFSLQGFPCEQNFTGKTLFSLQGRVCSLVNVTVVVVPNQCFFVKVEIRDKMTNMIGL